MLRGGLFLAALACLAAPADSRIVAAAYEGPTARYPHGVLGDAIEHETLVVTLADGRRLSVTHPPPLVFEDTAPRLADLDGDGAPEVIVVEAHERRGARLAVWGLRAGRLEQRAASPFIGTRFRWLAPAGAGDLDGDGFAEIAWVDRPHLAKTLRVWRYLPEGPRLEPVADLAGVTNHRIGETDIAGGLRDCGAGPEIVLADAGWGRLLAVRLAAGRLTARDIGPHAGRPGFAAALACAGP
ncbi:VCBS repeat-containing protein [Rhodosalinus halophilus]|uniref:VCBS repeat-containing protein n=1 Tax=Rhodosalinus halophilus TaxID=2259333 RepID=A0A365UC48_9RHOB|nr:VCBS repeat-containing protein [Rhodosalinus halophilus]RBI86997.1 VCBS repeat-containing protein [Rhodosalinus halophilus]